MRPAPATAQQTLDQIVDSAAISLRAIESLIKAPNEKSESALSEAKRALETFYTNATYATLLAAQQAKAEREATPVPEAIL
jgi:hypothetical protein